MRRENQQVKKGKEVKKISEMTKGQIKYETKRAVKNGMTLEEWIEFKNTKSEVTLYHYTKGRNLPHILKDGFLDLEPPHEEMVINGEVIKTSYYGCENYLWMTSEEHIPTCTLPFRMNDDFKHEGLCPNTANGFFRFSFKLSDFDTVHHFNNSKLFQQLKNKKHGYENLYDFFVRTAGADTNCWYVSKKQLPISAMKIEVLIDADWTEEDFLEGKDHSRIKSEGKWVDCTHEVATHQFTKNLEKGLATKIASNDNDNFKEVA